MYGVFNQDFARKFRVTAIPDQNDSVTGKILSTIGEGLGVCLLMIAGYIAIGLAFSL